MSNVIPFRRKHEEPLRPKGCICPTVGVAQSKGKREPVVVYQAHCPIHGTGRRSA